MSQAAIFASNQVYLSRVVRDIVFRVDKQDVFGFQIRVGDFVVMQNYWIKRYIVSTAKTKGADQLRDLHLTAVHS